jgi:mevalonate kinase
VSEIVTSAPAKVIFFGEHGVNRQQPALATAVDLRLYCHVTPQADDHYHFRSGDRQESYRRADLLADKTVIDELRLTQNYDAIRNGARRYLSVPAWDRGRRQRAQWRWRPVTPLGMN